MKIKVIDSPCGTGKTEYAISYMKENREDSRFIYVTPYLDEIKRVIGSVSFDIVEPKGVNKSKSLRDLIIKGKSIATTHALFGMGDAELADLIVSQGYEIILDEVMTVLQPVSLGEGDISLLLDNDLIFIGDDGIVSVTDKGWEATKKKLKYKADFDLISTGNVLLINNCMMVWEFPVGLLNSFKSITILTYLFKEQTMYNYLLANGAEYSFYYLFDYKLCAGNCSYDGRRYKDLISIYDGKMNTVGTVDYSLSSSWYVSNSSYYSKKILENNVYNFFRNIQNSSADSSLWTCKKDKSDKVPLLKVKSYVNSFLEMNARATNLYSERNTCAYLANRYENPVIHNYFVKHGLSVNNDMYALSEMIQWLFRSAIRKDKKISLYIPSKRMRSILISWLDGNFETQYKEGVNSETK